MSFGAMVTPVVGAARRVGMRGRVAVGEALTNFEGVRGKFRGLLLEGNEEFKGVHVAEGAGLELFEEVFPEVVQSRGIGSISNADFAHWDYEEKGNLVEMTRGERHAPELLEALGAGAERTYSYVSVGGPSAFIANHLTQARRAKERGGAEAAASAMEGSAHFFLSRKDSNHDGSAYYFHVRDAFPVYVNRINRGLYCVYIDLWKRVQLALDPERFLRRVEETEGHVKISMNWGNLLRRPSLLWKVFVPNLALLVKNLYCGGRDLNEVLEHAKRTPAVAGELAEFLGVPLTDFVVVNERQKACYVNIDETYDVVKHFEWLQRFGEIPYEVLDKREHGFGSEHVKQVLWFPEDGSIGAFFLDRLQEQFVRRGGDLADSHQLERVSYAPGDAERPIVVQLRNTRDGSVTTVATRKLGLSLGPSARYTLNGEEVVSEVMYAAGSSSVLFVAVDLDENPDFDMTKFTYFVDSVNQHWTPISAKEAERDGRRYAFVAMHMTGGGNFPSRFTRPDVVLSLLSNCEKLYDLKGRKGVHYDIVQLRGCGRGVSASNTISFAKVGDDIAISYALGGIGMTTMFPNAEVMYQLQHGDASSRSPLRPDGLIQNIDYSSMVTYA